MGASDCMMLTLVVVWLMEVVWQRPTGRISPHPPPSHSLEEKEEL
ncbi:hypothetical protein E2C01_068304 [Portunus trituberculatus]|uniref:Uncharacterized protein n=1 Tax=Portunus trituberculatus TaxID=210409 RepID=A0A5B7HM20_PORTR|nr:hypothetical protein [Portunus trituberculatus]